MSWMHDDFWLDPPKYPNDWQGEPAYPPENPAHPHFQRMGAWHDLGKNGEYLRSTATKWYYCHPSNGKVWHLAGPGRGREGVVLARELEGVMQPDFEIRWSEGAYTIGAKPERVDYKKRRINMGVAIQPNLNAERIEEPNPFSYRMIEDSWWSSWSETVPGFLGSFTRTHGFRWLRVLLGEATKGALSIDPTGNDNNSVIHNMAIDAAWPFYAKRPLKRVWKVNPADVYAKGKAEGVIAIANRGTWESWPKFLVRGSGEVWIQDGIEGRMVKLPKLYPTDGAYMMVDTDPTARTITTEKDPVDSQLVKYLRNSQLLDLLLHDVTASRLPAQRRIPGGIGFDGKIPPRTVAHIKVSHTNPQGSITCIMPQYFRMAWS
ncbi:minor tail protein [Mycobacterium phage Mufasa]|uniref:Minor tail protein n=1 Tax=Mycobacterium phage Mufasa TaxID=1718600 RepID=A0A0M4S3U0_9CAUD|nr:minor tail protein [Mycobacterium phage Mufasa]ALF00452.1 minor tail protein [Mycobacterium phage Mufasa]